MVFSIFRLLHFVNIIEGPLEIDLEQYYSWPVSTQDIKDCLKKTLYSKQNREASFTDYCL